jgi:hypothetical protein
MGRSLTLLVDMGENFDVLSRWKAAAALAPVVMAMSMLLGCAEVSLRARDVNLRNARLVFMPSMVALYRIEGCDLPFDDWRSKAGRAKVDALLRYYAAAAHGRLADLRELAGIEMGAADFYDVMNSLAARMFADRGSRPIGSWKIPPLGDWATVLNADYVVFVVARGSILLPSGQAFCGNGIRSPQRWAAVVVAELVTGQIVRFDGTMLEDIDTAPLSQRVGKILERALDLPTEPGP